MQHPGHTLLRCCTDARPARVSRWRPAHVGNARPAASSAPALGPCWTVCTHPLAAPNAPHTPAHPSTPQHTWRRGPAARSRLPLSCGPITPSQDLWTLVPTACSLQPGAAPPSHAPPHPPTAPPTSPDRSLSRTTLMSTPGAPPSSGSPVNRLDMCCLAQSSLEGLQARRKRGTFWHVPCRERARVGREPSTHDMWPGRWWVVPRQSEVGGGGGSCLFFSSQCHPLTFFPSARASTTQRGSPQPQAAMMATLL